MTFSGTAGQRVSLRGTNGMSGQNLLCDVGVSLLKPDTSTLAGPTCMEGSGFIDVVTLPVTGTYTVVVNPVVWVVGNLTLQLYDVPADTTGTITAGGSAETVMLSTPGQNGSLTFSGTAGQRVSLQGTNGMSGQNLLCDVGVSILKPDTSTLAGSTCMEGSGFIDVVTLPVAGTYTVVVNPVVWVVGNLTLQLYDVQDTTGTVTIGGSPVAVTLSTPGQKGTLTFTGTASQQVTVRMTGNTYGSVTVRLRRPDGTQMTASTSISTNFNLATQTLPTTGTYTIEIDPNVANTGTINVSVTNPSRKQPVMTNRLRLALSSLIVVLAATSSGGPGLGARQHAGRGEDGRSTTQLPDGAILMLGGVRESGDVVVYDPASRTTRPASRLRVPRAWHTATVLPDGTVLIAGGIGPDGQLVQEVERFDPVSGELTLVEDAAFTPRARHTATLLTDGRVLFAGGETPGGGGVRAELWDFVANTAEPISGPPPVNRLNGDAELLADGTVQLLGGTIPDRGQPPAPEIFDPGLTAFRSPSGRLAASGLAAVAGVLPADGAEDVAIGVRIALRFSAPVHPTSVAVRLEAVGEHGASTVPFSVVIAEGGRLAFVHPADGLAPDSVYRLTLASARTASGRRLAPFSSTFRTVRAPDPPDPAGAVDDGPEGDGRGLDSAWRKLPPLQAPPGVTALAGQALRLNGLPLASVTIDIDGRRVRTDRTGRFLMRLGSAPSGWREMRIDGRTANRRTRTYGVFETAVQIKGGKTVSLPYTIWMPALDTANAVRIASPTTTETVITTPHIPGLELHLPPHSVVTDHDGKIVREISITPIPVDRPPFPLPTGVDVPIYFTIQPGGAYVAVKSYGGRQGAWLVYPNYTQQPAGSEYQFWHYDPEAKGWHVYGMGRVAPSGRQVVPNPDVALYEFTGAMINSGQTPGTKTNPARRMATSWCCRRGCS